MNEELATSTYLRRYAIAKRIAISSKQSLRIRQLNREVANLKRKLYRLQNPDWHTSRRWGSNRHSSYMKYGLASRVTRYTGDNEWRYAIILKPGVSPISYYREARKAGGIEFMKGGYSVPGFFTPYTAKSHKSRRNGQEVWIIVFDMRRDC